VLSCPGFAFITLPLESESLDLKIGPFQQYVTAALICCKDNREEVPSRFTIVRLCAFAFNTSLTGE
jgi:hypothetical protein